MAEDQQTLATGTEEQEPQREHDHPAPEVADMEVEASPDAPPVEELDEETRARRDAALRHVRKLGDPVLRSPVRSRAWGS
jgi:hypothetical protein